MKPTPAGWPRISPSIFYEDAGAAIDWLCAAFGFQVRIRIEGEGGRIEHSELEFGPDGLIMVGSAGGKTHGGGDRPFVSPRQVDGRTTQAACLFVDDVDAHCEKARAAGASIADEPKTNDYGEDYWTDRSYRAVDPEGHHWWFMQRLRSAGDAPLG